MTEEKHVVNPDADTGAHGDQLSAVNPPSPYDSSSGKVESRLEDQPVEEVDKMTERRVLRKLDKRIVPMVMWCYLMNMMDRGKLSLFLVRE